MDRYLNASLAEFNLAAGGYNRNWERNTAWLMRKLVFTLQTGNPYIEKQNKPKNEKDIILLSIDPDPEEDPENIVKEAEEFENELKNG